MLRTVETKQVSSAHRVGVTNCVDFNDVIPESTTTKPTSEEASDFIHECAFRKVRLLLFGEDGNDEEFDVHVYGWSRFENAPGQTLVDVWVPTLLFAGACIVGTNTGVEGAVVSDSDRFVDTITIHGNPGDSAAKIVNPAGASSLLASVTLDTRGFDLLQISFDKGTNLNANALVRFF